MYWLFFSFFTVPIIDVIEAKNFYYSTNGYDTFQIGGFTLDGHFDWHGKLNLQKHDFRIELFTSKLFWSQSFEFENLQKMLLYVLIFSENLMFCKS